MMDFIYINVGNFIYLGVQWAISVALVRLGGFEDAGLFSLGLTVSTMFGMIANYGLRSFQITDVKNRFSDYTYIVSRIITIIIAFAACLVYSIVKKFDVSTLLIVLIFMLYKCVEAYSDVLSAIWQKNNRMIDVGISMGIRGIANMIFFFLCFLYSHNIIIAIAAMAFSSFLTLLLFDFVKTKKYLKQTQLFKRFSKADIIPLLLTGMLTMLFVFSTTLFNSIPKLIVEKKCGVSLLGVFSSVFAPTVVISTFAVGVLLPVAPKLAESFIRGDRKSIFKTISVCNLIFVATGVAAELLSIVVGKQLFRIVYGEEIIPYFNLFYYVIIVSVLISVVNSYSTLLIAARKLKQLLAFSGSSCVLVLIASYLIIPKYSIYGAAYAMIGVLAVQFIAESIFIFYLLKKLNPEKSKGIG